MIKLVENERKQLLNGLSDAIKEVYKFMKLNNSKNLFYYNL